MVDQINLIRVRYTILGTMMRRPDCVGEVMARLSSSAFDGEATRGLFEAISRLHSRGAPIDPVTVEAEAGEDFGVAVDEALQYDTDNVLYYCGILEEESRLYNVQCDAFALAEAQDLTAVNKILDRLNGLMVSRQKFEVMSSAEAAMEFYKRITSKEKPEYLSWGIDALDKRLYTELGDFVVIGGYPSSGKTLLSLQFALTMAKKYRVGFFSLETNTQKLMDRLVTFMAQVPLENIKQRTFSDSGLKSVASALADFSKLPFDIIRCAGATVRDIQAMALNKRYQVIFVDYLQLVISPGKTRYEAVTNTSQDLHIMAQSHGITVISLAQLSRPESVNGKPKPPGMSSFRESGQIEQDADVAMLLWPTDVNDNTSNRILKVGKNKEGEKLGLELKFDGSLQTMTPIKPSLMTELSRIKAEEKAEAAAKQMGFTDITNKEDGDCPF